MPVLLHYLRRQWEYSFPPLPSNLRNAGWIQIQIIGSESVVSSHVIRRRRRRHAPVTAPASSPLDSLYSVKLQKDTKPKSKVYENIHFIVYIVAWIANLLISFSHHCKALIFWLCYMRVIDYQWSTLLKLQNVINLKQKLFSAHLHTIYSYFSCPKSVFLLFNLLSPWLLPFFLYNATFCCLLSLFLRQKPII